MLATALAGVSLAWACSGPEIGIPADGTAAAASAKASPAASAQSASSADAAPAPAAAPSSASSPASSGANPAGSASLTAPASSSVASGSASGARRSEAAHGKSPAVPEAANGTSPGAGDNRARSGAGAGGSSSPTTSSFAAHVRSQFAARVRGATEGVTRRGGQSVFTSSAGPKHKPSSKASSARPPANGPWSDSGTSSKPAPSLTSAHAFSSGQSGGFGGSVTAGIALLGLGLAGVLGGFMVAVGRRRRAESPNRK